MLAVRALLKEHHQLIWILKGQRLEQHGSHYGKECRISANSKRQYEDRNRGKAGVL